MDITHEVPMTAKRPRGRPSSYSQEVAERICTRLANGENLKRICADSDMPDFVTVWRWENSNEEFRNLSARAREVGTHNLADDCLNIADDPTIDPQDKRIRIDTRIRLIGKWNAKRYGDKLTHSGDDEAPIKVERIVRRIVHADD
jgi:hypothetical protein